ncbi:MAG TPA: hypothetical protein VJ724_10460 [Tahibacter sp.]|nr:hypothetical protein [Tahibacter sp.]
MVSKTLKALVALGLVAAAGQSFALYSIGGPYIYDGYCASFMKPDGHGRVYSSTTMAGCQALLSAGMAAEPGPYTEFNACHVCAQKFSYHLAVQDPGTWVSSETATQFQNATNELRRRFRIDEYERAQAELEQSLSPEATCPAK